MLDSWNSRFWQPTTSLLMFCCYYCRWGCSCQRDCGVLQFLWAIWLHCHSADSI